MKPELARKVNLVSLFMEYFNYGIIFFIHIFQPM